MRIPRFFGVVLLTLVTACTAHPQSCKDHFVGGSPPTITNQSLTKQTTMLCFEGYATMHSGVSLGQYVKATTDYKSLTIKI